MSCPMLTKGEKSSDPQLFNLGQRHNKGYIKLPSDLKKNII